MYLVASPDPFLSSVSCLSTILSVSHLQNVARFHAGQEGVRDDERSGRPFSTDICDVILRLLEQNIDSLSQDTSKPRFTPEMTVLRLSADLGLKFHSACRIPHWLSEQQKAERVSLSQDILQTMKDFGPRQQNN
jgi:hypothetical protein